MLLRLYLTFDLRLLTYPLMFTRREARVAGQRGAFSTASSTFTSVLARASGLSCSSSR